MGRTIQTQKGKSRWYDLPMTEQEIERGNAIGKKHRQRYTPPTALSPPPPELIMHSRAVCPILRLVGFRSLAVASLCEGLMAHPSSRLTRSDSPLPFVLSWFFSAGPRTRPSFQVPSW